MQKILPFLLLLACDAPVDYVPALKLEAEAPNRHGGESAWSIEDCEMSDEYVDTCDERHACNVARVIEDFEEIESIAICRATCMREHLDCLETEDDFELCLACEFTAGACMSACKD